MREKSYPPRSGRRQRPGLRRRDGRSERRVDVPQMVLALVDGVSPEPEHGPLTGFRKVVDAGPLKLALVEAGKSPSEQLGSDLQLLGDIVRRLGRVPAEVRTLLPMHAGEARALLHEREVHPFTLDQEHVADVAAVLERRPDARPRSGADGLRENGSERSFDNRMAKRPPSNRRAPGTAPASSVS